MSCLDSLKLLLEETTTKVVPKTDWILLKGITLLLLPRKASRLTSTLVKRLIKSNSLHESSLSRFFGFVLRHDLDWNTFQRKLMQSKSIISCNPRLLLVFLTQQQILSRTSTTTCWTWTPLKVFICQRIKTSHSRLLLVLSTKTVKSKIALILIWAKKHHHHQHRRRHVWTWKTWRRNCCTRKRNSRRLIRN